MYKIIIIPSITLLLFFIATGNIWGQCTTVNCNGTTAPGDFATAIGDRTKAEGVASFSSGLETHAFGHYSTAFGVHSIAYGYNSFAVGMMSNAEKSSSIVIGDFLHATAGRSILIGHGVNVSSPLTNNTPHSLMIGFNSTNPTFFVSKSTSSSSHNLTGRIGIGNVTKPDAKLHLRADAGEAAAVFIQPHNWDNGDHASLLLGNAKHGISAKANIGLAFSSENNYVFGDGNVGLGINSPKEKLHVNGHIALNSKITFKTPGAEIIWGSNKMLFKGYKGLEESKHISKGDGDDPHAVGGLRTIMTLDASTGYVGIRTEKPEYNLHVNGSTFTKYFTFYNEQSPPREGSILQCDNRGNAYWQDPAKISLWKVNPNNGVDLYFPVGTEGNVGIGTINTYGYRLAVNGKILTDEVMIKHPDEWYDYVFEPEYKLMPLKELEEYINNAGHLPSVPSEAEVTQNGYGLAQMNGILLKKVEELTLYIIEQQKAIETQNEKMENQNKKINTLAKRLSTLEE